MNSEAIFYGAVHIHIASGLNTQPEDAVRKAAHLYQLCRTKAEEINKAENKRWLTELQEEGQGRKNGN